MTNFLGGGAKNFTLFLVTILVQNQCHKRIILVQNKRHKLSHGCMRFLKDNMRLCVIFCVKMVVSKADPRLPRHSIHFQPNQAPTAGQIDSMGYF